MTRSTTQTDAAFAVCSRRYREKSLRSQVLEVLTENDVALPSIEHLDLIGRSAEQAQALLFSAAIAEPTGDELRAFFDLFVCSCAGVRAD